SNSMPVVLLGDLNAEPGWEEINVITTTLNDTWKLSKGNLDGFTWPNDEPRQRIDYIFNNSFLSVESCSLVDSSASDHLPVICDFTFSQQ
ncbi:MAG: endonuclease/exonuclease/phosphatase family protein, partial [Candidatus Heimdallarchaeota archaeon]